MHSYTYEYLTPTTAQRDTMDKVRTAARDFSAVLEAQLPNGPDKSFVLRNHRTTAMWANIAITRLPDGTPRL